MTRLGIAGKLQLNVQSTNACEACFQPSRDRAHRQALVLRGMCLRRSAAGMLEAETRFRTVPAVRSLVNRAVAIEDYLYGDSQSDR